MALALDDIRWIGRMEEGLALGREAKRPVLLMPVGQGMDTRDGWCPAASYSRASLSHPEIVRLLQEAFVPVRFSMHLQGPGADDSGRKFVAGQPQTGPFDIYPPDLFVVSPEAEVLGRLPFDSTPDEVSSFLREILKKRPDLSPEPTVLEAEPPTDPAEVSLLAIEERYEASTPERTWWRVHEAMLFRVDERDRPPRPAPPQPDQAKAALVPDLEEWLAAHGDAHRDLAALARVLLGGARAHAGDPEGARAAWESVLALHPHHALRHRAAYNLIEPGAFPCLPQPELVGAPRPSAAEAGIVVPDEAVRARNLELVRSDPRYLAVREGLPFVRIPAGTFTMGGTPAVQAREVPVRRVTISRPFAISAWPITRELWRLFRPGDHPGRESEGLAAVLPAVRLSWLDVTEFCEFLSKLDGRRYRLPTEAEWEYAARGGVEEKQYPWGDETPDHDRCNYVNPRPVPVASYPANGYGLFDSVGNCFEWCADYYAKDAYSRTPTEVTDPTGPDLATAKAGSPTGDAGRVARGGGWIGNEMCLINCRNSWRIGWPPNFKWCNLGARLVIDE